LVEAGVSQDELRQILTQLRNMVKSAVPAPVPQPALPNWSSQPPFPPQFSQVAPPVLPDPSSSTPMPNPPANIANILSSLLKAGVLSTSGVSANKNSSAEDETSTESKETKNEAFDEYRSAILSQNVGLNTLDLAK
jgi:pre-mRNA cleavage complex 2 protein Pcf11